MTDPVKLSGIVLVVRGDGRILATTNRRYGGFCLPGGKVDPGETPRIAAVRELREETSLIVTEKDLVWLCAGPSATESGRMVHMFYARHVRGLPRDVEPGTRCEWMTLEALKEVPPFADYYKQWLPDGIDHLRPTECG